MARIFLTLLWKEYRELRWNVLALVGITLSLPVYAALRAPDAAWFWVLLMLGIYAGVGGICFGMWSAAGDRATGAASFLAALPIHPAWLGLVKLGVSFVAVQLPILGLALFGGMVARRFVEPSGQEIGLGLLVTACGLCTMHVALTTAFFGLGQRTELRAAGRGLLALTVWGLAFLLSIALGGVSRTTWPAYLAAFGPPVYLLGNPPIPPGVVGGFVTITACAMLALAAGFVRLYSIALTPRVTRPRERWMDWFAGPSSSPLLSLARKQLSECAPFVASVTGIALLLAVMAVGIEALIQPAVVQRYGLARMAGIFAVSACGGGYLLSLLLGIAAFAGDLEPKVNTFWRSRPISPSLWFWTKYWVALSSVLVAVGFPATLGFIAAEAGFSRGALAQSLGILSWMALGWFGIFSAAVVSTCLIRWPLHSGLLAFALVAGSVGLAQWIDEGWFGSGPLQHPLLVIGVWFSTSIAATLIAWRVAVRDIVAFG